MSPPPAPHTRLNGYRRRRTLPPDTPTRPRKVQTTRMLKVHCPTVGCGFMVRMTQKWLSQGSPICPRHHMQMERPTNGV